jgi:hypothetical protein
MFNIARGCFAYYYYAVENSLVVTAAAGANGPPFTSAADSQFVVVPIETTGLEADSTIVDHKTLAAVLAGTSNEQLTLGRKFLTDADLAAVPAPEVNEVDTLDLDFPDITYTNGDGNAISKLIVGFMPNAAAADSAIVPCLLVDYVKDPDGTTFVVQIGVTGIYRSS